MFVGFNFKIYERRWNQRFLSAALKIIAEIAGIITFNDFEIGITGVDDTVQRNNRIILLIINILYISKAL